MGKVDDRGEMLLGCIYDEVDREINPNDEDCPFCGGEGVTFDCFGRCLAFIRPASGIRLLAIEVRVRRQLKLCEAGGGSLITNEILPAANTA